MWNSTFFSKPSPDTKHYFLIFCQFLCFTFLSLLKLTSLILFPLLISYFCHVLYFCCDHFFLLICKIHMYMYITILLLCFFWFAVCDFRVSLFYRKIFSLSKITILFFVLLGVVLRRVSSVPCLYMFLLGFLKVLYTLPGLLKDLRLEITLGISVSLIFLPYPKRQGTN